MKAPRQKILRNRVKCNKCGDIIESESVYNFVTCKCGAVSIDGGHEYLKRSAKSPKDFHDLSVVIEEV